MKIYFDNKEFQFEKEDENIVQVAEKNGVQITAPCYKNKKNVGCCRVCVIMVDNKEAYACTTKPFDGMKITYDTEKLNTMRKERLKAYSENIKNGDSAGTCCSSSSEKGNKNTGSCGCNSNKEKGSCGCGSNKETHCSS